MDWGGAVCTRLSFQHRMLINFDSGGFPVGRVPNPSGTTDVGDGLTVGWVPREQKMLQRHLPRAINHQVYSYTKIKNHASIRVLTLNPGP